MVCMVGSGARGRQIGGEPPRAGHTIGRTRERLGEAVFKQLWNDFVQAMREAIWRVVRAGLLGAALGVLVAGGGAYLIERAWPPSMLAYAATVAITLLLGYSVAATVALIEGARGLASAVSQLDDVARATADAGLNVLDAMVDAVDGPNRHGFRGTRAPTVQSGGYPSHGYASSDGYPSGYPAQVLVPPEYHSPVSGDHPTWPMTTGGHLTDNSQ